jgi:kynurenine/2-aminoadipate aminotransferase
LEGILKNWPKESHSSRPKVLYTIPTGQNPSGFTTSYERKKKLYEIARTFGLLILEDDPYYQLHFSPSKRPKSLFHLDHDGRVLRFDSLSKVMSSGMRVGWVTGPNLLVDRIQLMQQARYERDRERK